ncbi:MAG: di-heme oxidoredictase family protein [Pseudomonadota bacterium]
MPGERAAIPTRRRLRLAGGCVLAACALSTASPSAAALSAAERARILAPASEFTAPERWESLSGGTATNRKRFDREAFSLPSASLKFEDRAEFFVGNGLFRRLWVSSPSSTRSADGLGPLYNARACQRCHLKDGRGHPPASPDDSRVSLLLRLGVPNGTDEHMPEPVYGAQFQDLAVPGRDAEGHVEVTYTKRARFLSDGAQVELRMPHYRLTRLAYGTMDPATVVSPRIAPPMIGLGLLEAIAEKDLEARADPDDRDGDGISGRLPVVRSNAHGRRLAGRFGWRSEQPTIIDQTAAALAGDIGISSALMPAAFGDCTSAQPACRAGPHGDDEISDGFEASNEMLRAMEFYSQNLAVPARRDVAAPKVLRGKALFYDAGCIACHVPKHATRRDFPVKALAGQLIWPYTDLLLHDMGADLADRDLSGRVVDREWRTPPLWGLGLTRVVNGHMQLLHDGRARGLAEAILWHGGEARATRDRFAAMNRLDREALFAFLMSL